jgi:exosortase H (IPTLxxWG-CTERM-specific)
MFRFGAIFAAVLVALFVAELTPWGQAYFVAPWTAGVASVCASIMSAFDPMVMASGDVIRSARTGFAIQILAGCNGVEAMIVLVAAIVAFPAPWKNRVVGAIAGIAAIQMLNLVRIASLYYLGQWSPGAFEWAHLYLWQPLIMLDALVVFLVWLRALPRHGIVTALAVSSRA